MVQQHLLLDLVEVVVVEGHITKRREDLVQQVKDFLEQLRHKDLLVVVVVVQADLVKVHQATQMEAVE